MEKKLKIYIYISFILQFIDSARFMASSLSHLVNNLSEGIHWFNVSFDKMIRHLKHVKWNYCKVLRLFSRIYKL